MRRAHIVVQSSYKLLTLHPASASTISTTSSCGSLLLAAFVGDLGAPFSDRPSHPSCFSSFFSCFFLAPLLRDGQHLISHKSQAM